MKDSNTYSINEFVNQMVERGYASRKDKKQIVEWCEKRHTNRFDEDDLIDCYRYFENRRIGLGYSCGKWRVDSEGHKTTKRYFDDNGNS